MKILAALIVLLGLFGAVPCLAFSKDGIIVDAQACQPVPAALDAAGNKIVGQDWRLYEPNMCLFPVKSPNGKVVLEILALDVPKADDANALVFKNGLAVSQDDASGGSDPIPNPTVISLGGRALATLAEPFPNNDPATSVIEFSDWRGGYPFRIIQYVNDPTQEAAHLPFCPPPYLWNAVAQKYVEAKGDYYGVCPGQR